MGATIGSARQSIKSGGADTDRPTLFSGSVRDTQNVATYLDQPYRQVPVQVVYRPSSHPPSILLRSCPPPSIHHPSAKSETKKLGARTNKTDEIRKICEVEFSQKKAIRCSVTTGLPYMAAESRRAPNTAVAHEGSSQPGDQPRTPPSRG